MTKETRIKELISAMQAFRKDAYQKAELLPEYLGLEKELITLTYNDIHAEYGKLRIWNVENHLEKLNEDCGHIADKELEEFKLGCKFISNAIRSEFSGNAGEYKAFRSLETLRCKNKVMKNIELKSGDHRTEIDAIVFTEKAVFIIEVKNPHRDIYIDERGNYCRVGNTMNFDCNIGEKMNDKVFLLREALKSSGYSNANIISLVVFTNSAMHVDNRYEYITTCFLGSLPHIIERYDGNPLYTECDISAMMENVTAAECKKAYPIEFDIKQFKYCFANLMATLEEAAEKRSEDANVPETEDISRQPKAREEICEKSQATKIAANRASSNIVTAVGVAVAFSVGFIASQIFKSARK